MPSLFSSRTSLLRGICVPVCLLLLASCNGSTEQSSSNAEPPPTAEQSVDAETTVTGDLAESAREDARNAESQAQSPNESKKAMDDQKQRIATFGGGCFWCVEAVFQELEGVTAVVSGYAGGQIENPTYEQICTGATGHAEVCQITYDPTRVEFKELLEVFWKTHDPTTLNRQGFDVGTQYRSVIFYHSAEQQEQAETYRRKLDESGIFGSPIVTEISAAPQFYKAEEYHQNYFRSHPEAGYCAAVIQPKMSKFRKVFEDKLRSAEQAGADSESP